jgi:NAD(P)-dependent dehydrogenase (short-subunit alcohol dehydrogenase family)
MKQRVVVVTGCSSGFGRDVSLALARKGARVYATMRDSRGRNADNASNLLAAAAAEGVDLRVIEMDVQSTASVDASAAEVLRESGAPDVVINNAGQMYVGIAEAFTADEVTNQLDVNVVGVHRVTRAFLPAMRTRGTGLFINISSIAGRLAVPFNGIYHASKWALEGYSLALRGELASSGIDVVVVEPGPFSTALFPTMRLPADAEGRGATYPAVVHDTFAGIGAMFDGMFADPNTPTDPSLVVDRMVELVGMPGGRRPFRSVVGVDFGVTARNAAVESHDAAVLQGAGLTSFATLTPSTES